MNFSYFTLSPGVPDALLGWAVSSFWRCYTFNSVLFFLLSLSLSLCVCVLERERDRERETHSVCKFLSHCECVRVYKTRCGSFGVI